MAKGKTIFTVYRCPTCKKPSRTRTYNKQKKAAPELKIFCSQCRKHFVQKPKDQKKAAK